jgi:ribose transport system permease protein
MAIINNALIIGRVSGYWQEVILGMILILAVAMDQLLLRRLQSKVF